MSNTKIIGFDYNNHDDFVKDLKLKTDDESKKALKSYKNANIAWWIEITTFAFFATIQFMNKNIDLSETYYIVWCVILLVPMLAAVILNIEYKSYIKRHNIKIFEEEIYYYVK